MIEQAVERFPVLGPVALLALGLSLALMVLLRPWLSRYAMARPNARSSHRDPTPQGGGMAVVAAKQDAHLWEVTPLDDDLDSVFRYLVGR